MPQPPAYNRSKDFTEDFGNESDHSSFNAELDSAANSINDIRTNLAILQADDGKLRPDVVTSDSLADELIDYLIDQATQGAVSAEQGAVAAAALAEASESAAQASAAAAAASESAAAAAVDRLNQNGSANTVLSSMADGSALKVVCIGDSITWGSDANNPGTQVTTPYPARLEDILQAYYRNASVTVVNAGDSGDDSSQMLARFATDVVAESPDVIVIMAGVNDARGDRAITPFEYEQNLQSMIRLAGSTPVILVSPTQVAKAQNNATTRPQAVTFYRDTMRRVAHLTGSKHVDLHGMLSNIYETHAVGRGLIDADGLHYTEYGYSLIAEAIFAEGFANADITVSPGAFKNVTGAWVSYAGTPTWRIPQTDDGIDIELSNTSAKLFLYVEDFRECALALHCFISNSGTAGKIAVTNLSISGATAVNYTLSHTNNGTNFTFGDYPIVTCSLRPGLNEILLDSTGFFARFSGFSIIETPQYFFQTTKNLTIPADYGQELYGATKWMARGVQEIGPAPAAVYDLTDEVVPFVKLFPRPDGLTTAWRFRGLVQVGSSIKFGQATGNGQIYRNAFDLVFNSGQAVFRGFSSAGVAAILKTDATITTSATGDQHFIDIVTGPTSFAIYIDGALFHTETVPLSISPCMIATATSAGTARPVLFNPPVVKGTQEPHTGLIRGEKWIDFETDVLHFVNKDGTEKTLTFV